MEEQAFGNLYAARGESSRSTRISPGRMTGWMDALPRGEDRSIWFGYSCDAGGRKKPESADTNLQSLVKVKWREEAAASQWKRLWDGENGIS